MWCRGSCRVFCRHYSDVESVVAVVSYLVEPAVDVVVVGFLVEPAADGDVGSTDVVIASVASAN